MCILRADDQRDHIGDVHLTEHHHPADRLEPTTEPTRPEVRRTLLEAVRVSGATKANPGANAATSQDFLYGNDGLPD
jgi:hypothetical protein